MTDRRIRALENSTAPAAQWRPMHSDDLPAIKHISDVVHRTYSEEESVYAERLALYPEGCSTLVCDGEVIGYIVTHPWHRGLSPALNEVLGAIPTENADYYLHDIALLPQARGKGLGEAALARVVDIARQRGFTAVSLVAVNGAETYWASRGFVIDDCDTEGTTYGPGTFRMRLPVD